VTPARTTSNGWRDILGLVAVLCRSSDHILCSKGDEP
jgi:hypothetical protein